MKKEYASNVQLSQLSLVDGPPTADDTPADAGTPTTSGTHGASDPGRVSAEKPSPPRVEPIARSTPGIARREPSSERIARRAQAMREAAVSESEARSESSGNRRGRRVGASLNRKQLILIAGVLGSMVLVAGLMVMLSPREPAQTDLTQPTPPAITPTAPAANAGTPKEPPSEDYPGRVQALKAAGNWNVLVIYAGEWTRKQPTNPEAWRELSAGYIKLRQFPDALDAATKAVQVAPEGFLGWQNLGLVNVALQQSADALVAFDHAVALNDKDVISLVQTGTLNTQLGRYPEARIAFARALVASPDNTEALCGAAVVAQREGRAQDAQAMTGRLQSLNGVCPDPNLGQSVRVLASPPKNPTASPARR